MGFILVYFIIVVAVVEIAVVLMRATGLNREVARFQVVSLLTSTGYTTKESELISDHPVRRRIGMFLILFGVVSFAVVVSAVANVVAPEFRLAKMEIAAGLLLMLLLVARVPRTFRYLSSRLSESTEERFALHELSVKDALLLDKRDVFSEVVIGADSPFVGSIADDIIPVDADLNLMYVRRGARMLRKTRYATPLEAGDALCFYGRGDELNRLFFRDAKAETAVANEREARA